MYRFQYISQGRTPEEHLANCHEVLMAGGKWIQLRMKNYPDEIVEKTALELQLSCNKMGTTFILNDNVHLAKKINAAGVHLGLTDMPVKEARLILGPDKIIGGTANTFDEVIQRIEEGCNYIGLGPYRFTPTKDKLSPVLGLEGYSALINRLDERQRKTPIVAIGGIQEEDILPILETGVSGIALSGFLTHSNNKKEIIQRINKKIYGSF